MAKQAQLAAANEAQEPTRPVLPDRLRLLAWLYAVFTPHPLTAQRARSLLEDAALKPYRPPGGAPCDAEALTALVELGVAERWPNGDIAVTPDCGLSLMREAREEGALGPILAALARLKQHEDTPLPKDAGPRARMDASARDSLSAEVLLRGYLLAGDLERFQALHAQHNVYGREFELLAEPFAEEALRAVPPAHLPSARRACLSHVIATAAPAEALIAFCDEVSEVPLDHAPATAYIRILQGRFAAADAVFDALPAEARQDVDARAGRAAAQALTAMLRGDDQQARQHIEETLQLHGGSSKRLVWPDDRSFSLALLALARLDEPDAQEMLHNIAAAHSFLDNHRGGVDLAQYAAAIKAKSGVPFELGHRGVGALFAGLRHCWLGQLPDDGRPLLAELAALRRRAIANGYDWVAAECGEVLRRWAPDALHGDGEERAPDHAALGTATLTTLAAPGVGWPEALATLEGLANGDEEAAQDAASENRIVWTLRSRTGEISLQARAQRRGANGAWTRGKQYGPKRLAAESTKMDYLLAQDKEALAAVSRRRVWYKHEDYFGIRSLYALAGHPHVVDEGGQPVEVVRREPELSVDADADGGVVVRVAPHRSGTDGAYSAHLPSPGRCEVTFYSAQHQRLCRVVPKDGLRLPSEAKGRFLQTVPALAGAVRVASSLAEDDGVATPVAADSEPWVRLEPLDAGLSVALEVEPVPASGVCFAPGEGGAVVFARRDGETMRAERDLAQEREARDKLVERCPPLASLPTTLRPLALPQPDACLELLELLKGCRARCRWLRGETLRVVAHASARSMRLATRSAAQWLQVSGELPIDDQRTLDLRQLLDLAEQKSKSRFLPLGNGEYLALTDAFRRQLDDLASVASAGGGKNGVRLHPLAALAVEDLVDAAEPQADDDGGWAALRERMHGAETIEPTVPSTLQAQLRPYQLEGYQWLSRLSRWGMGACLADDMGLGKTVQTLAMLLERGPAGPALVVAPTSVVPNWLAEARRFTPTLRARPYAGSAAARTRLLDGVGPLDVVIATYGLLQNDADPLAKLSWHTVVLDEAQAIKNPAANRSRAAKQLRANFRVITTGTPVQNNLMDLHSLFNFVNPGLLGSQRQFRIRFGLPIERDRNAIAQTRLRRLINPFVLRRLKTDVLDDLPSRTEITLHVQLSEEEASLYEALRQRAVDELVIAPDGAQMRLLAHLTRLRLACCSPKLVLNADDAPPDLPRATASAKLATFATTLAELLDNRHKVLVFSQFVMHLALVEEHLQKTGVHYQYLDGATSAKERTERIAAFQAGDGDVFLISLTAGGVGLNLTAADYVIHMDPWWNPAVEDQASDRAHRIGQTRPVTIYRLVAAGTIEEQIVALHHRKRDLAEQLLEATDAPPRLDIEEMMALLKQPFSG